MGLFTGKKICVTVIMSLSNRITLSNMKGTMMKRIHSAVLAVLLMASVGCNSTIEAKNRNNNNGFIAGACAIGAALFGVAGAVALADWCYSETDDQLISRVDRECRSIDAQYTQTMNYFGPRAGVGIHAPHRPIYAIEESVIY